MKYLPLLLCVTLLGCEPPQPSVTATKPTPEALPSITLLSKRVEQIDDTMYAIHGEVQNTGRVPTDWVTANVTIYDKSGNIIRSDVGPISINPLPPNQRATFNVVSHPVPDFYRYRITFTDRASREIEYQDRSK